MSTSRAAPSIGLVLALAASTAAGATAPPAHHQPVVVVTTSTLESAVDALLPPGAARVERLLPPGSCPGHFDLSPRALDWLRDARVVVRHDFQASLDARLSAAGTFGTALVSVPSGDGLLIPANYRKLVAALAPVLAERFPEAGREIRARARAQDNAADALADAARRRAEPWRGTPVVAATHQASFCRWLGLEVVAVLPPAEQTTPRDLERAAGAGAVMVVANLQEGAAPARSLAARLGLPVAVLSNFPGEEGFGSDYQTLLEADLDRLEAAWRSSH